MMYMKTLFIRIPSSLLLNAKDERLQIIHRYGACCTRVCAVCRPYRNRVTRVRCKVNVQAILKLHMIASTILIEVYRKIGDVICLEVVIDQSVFYSGFRIHRSDRPAFAINRCIITI